MYFCGICRKKFDSAWSLVQHVQSAHNIRIYFDATSPVSALETATSRAPVTPTPGPGGMPHGLPGLDPHFSNLLRMPLGERPGFPGHPGGAPGSMPRPSHDFRMDQIMGQHFPFATAAAAAERPPLFNNIAASTASQVSALGLMGMDAQSIDFYSQRLKQLAGDDLTKIGRPGVPTTPNSPPLGMTNLNGGMRNEAPLTPRSHSSTPRPKSPTDSVRSDSTKPSPDTKTKEEPDSSLNNTSHSSILKNGIAGSESGDKHSSGSVDEDLLDEAMEEDDIEAEDLTTKSVSTPLSTPTSTPVPSSSTEKTSSVTNNIMSGSMIGDLMSKFGFSDIQEYQEAYKKALAESGAARAANNNNFIGSERSKTPQENGQGLRLREDIAKPGLNSLDLAAANNPFLAGFASHHFDPAKRLKLDREANSNNLFAGLWMPNHPAVNSRADLFKNLPKPAQSPSDLKSNSSRTGRKRSSIADIDLPPLPPGVNLPPMEPSALKAIAAKGRLAALFDPEQVHFSFFKNLQIFDFEVLHLEVFVFEVFGFKVFDFKVFNFEVFDFKVFNSEVFDFKVKTIFLFYSART